MAVKSTPVQHEDIDYADMCARLQERISSMESTMTEKLSQQQDRYETVIRSLNEKLEDQRSMVPVLNETGAAGVGGLMTGLGGLQGLAMMLEHLKEAELDVGGGGNWLSTVLDKNQQGQAGNAKLLLPLLGYCFEVMKALVIDSTALLQANSEREEKRRELLIKQFGEEVESEREREREIQAMAASDPILAGNNNVGGGGAVGSTHLATLSKLEALTRVEGLYRSNNDPLSGKSIAAELQ